ncbi:protein LIFEGUARD 2-like [Phragmites australis]|uniref:protein LIFEGUARD 2-like n=1 Tax=Phragmites australis TaxID=29695 RepID=UPI002D768E20|nr:protein LIFEGUARD 2-like [Phragmites australis]
MGKQGKCSHDAEACYPPGPAGGGAMYPYMIESPQLRWAFIRKVYVIVSLQLLLTVAVAAAVNLVGPIRVFFRARTPAAIAAFVLIILSPLIVMIPMIYWRKRHPINLVLLALFTVCVSFAVGLGCLSAKGIVILEAAGITMVVVVGLTLYTFWAAKRGYDFEFLGPFLVAACLVLLLYSLVQILFPMGRTMTLVYGCVAALVFSGFIIYDTDNLIKRYTYDEYVAAAIELYLDIINLFQAILAILEAADG